MSLFPFTACRILFESPAGMRLVARFESSPATGNDRRDFRTITLPFSRAQQFSGHIIFTIDPRSDPRTTSSVAARGAADLIGVFLGEHLNSQREKHVLLNLGDELVKIRHRGDLMRMVDTELRKLFHFTHCSIGLVSEDGASFMPFFTSADTAARQDPEYTDFFLHSHPVDDGVYGVALHAEQPCTFDVERFAADPAGPPYMAMNQRNGSKEFIAMSLPGESKPIGVIGFFTDRKGSADQRILQLLKGISSQVSIAIANIIANEEVRQKKEEKTVLLSLSNDIAAIRNKGDLRAVTIDKIRGLLESEVIIIDLIEREKQTHYIYFVDNEWQALQYPEYLARDEKECSVADGVYDKVLASDKVLCFNIPLLMKDPAIPSYVKIWNDMGRQRMAAVALRVGDRNIGVIWVYRKDAVNTHLLQGIAAQLSIAVFNILANDEIRKRDEEKSVLLSFSNEIAAVKDKKGLAAVISKYLKDLGLMREYIIALKNVEPRGTYGFFLYEETATYAKDPLFRQKIDTNIYLIGTLEEIAFRSTGPVRYSVRELLDIGLLTFPSVEYWEASDLIYIYSVPLKVSDSVIGILWIQPVRIREELLVSVAAQIAVAISNIISIEDIREREKEKSILLSFSNDIALWSKTRRSYRRSSTVILRIFF